MKKHQSTARALMGSIFHKNGGRFTLALMSSIFEALALLFTSLVLKLVADTVTDNAADMNFPVLVAMAAVGLGLMFLSGLAASFTVPRFQAVAMQNYKEAVFSRMAGKSIAAFTNESSALYISALSNDANTIETDYLALIFPLIKSLLSFAGAFTLMLINSPLLTFASIAFAFLPVLVSVLLGKPVANSQIKVSAANSRYIELIKDCIQGFSVIKSFKAEGPVSELVEGGIRDAENAKRRRNKFIGLITNMSMAAGWTTQMAVLLFGVWMILSGKNLTVGTMLLFVQLLNYVMEPIAQVPKFLAGRRSANVLAQKLSAALDANAAAGGSDIEGLEEGIEIKDLSFSYNGKDDVLKKVSFTFEAGKTYAVVGGSGSGKSTLLKLLMGAYPNYKGSVAYDGLESTLISADSLYDNVSMIEQNVFLFNSTIADNITMFRSFDREKIEMVISLSGLDDLVSRRGLDYLCGENGANLSGGEKQRISIARSLLKEAKVLLVDEATSSLDAETAANVSRSILDLEGLLRIVVTHDLDGALLKDFDRILVMKNGRLEECGSFDDLMDKKGYFYSLYTVSQ